jgi:WD40 repeat protein
MLGKKRSNNKKVDFKHKSIKDKMKILNSKKNTNNDDESIKSDENISEESSSENEKKISKKDNNNNNNNTNQFDTDLIENFEEKRIRLAKTFLKKLDNKDSENSSKLSEEENDLLEKFTHSNQYKKISFYENKNFSPSEKIFLKGHKSTITDLDISNDSNLILTSSKDCCGILFDITTEKKKSILKFANKPLNSCIFTHDNKTAFFGCKDRNIYHIDLISENIIQKIKAHNESVTGLYLDSNKEQFYSIGNDHVLKVWNSDSNSSFLLQTFYGHTSKINCICGIPGDNDKILTSGMDNYINLWKVDSQSFLQFKNNDIYPIDCLTSINNEYFLSGNFNGSLQVWKTNKKKYIKNYEFIHGIQKDFICKHDFFDSNLVKQHPKVKIGNPIFCINSIFNSDLFFSGSRNGEINFYKFNNDNNKDEINIELKKKLNLKCGGCINVIKSDKKNNFIAVGNGFDNKNGRWDCDYSAKLGITIIKLIN